MVNDPKFRTIARVSKQEISRVISVYVHMMTCASNAAERGRTEGWCDEDVATALDIEIEDVQAIREAMQGRVLDGDYLTGWEKRQPLREDDSASRSKAWRDAKKAEKNAEQTQPNATERNETLDKNREEEKREEKSKARASAAPKARKPAKSPLPADFSISDSVKEWAGKNGHANLQAHFDSFVGKARANGYCYADWDQALQNAIRDDWAKLATPQPRASPPAYESAKDRSRREASENLTGRRHDQRHDIIDI